jgi:hypothetical protein
MSANTCQSYFIIKLFLIFCDKFHRKQVWWLTYLNRKIGYGVNRLNPHTLLIIFKEKENEEYIYINHGCFTVGNRNRKRSSLRPDDT